MSIEFYNISKKRGNPIFSLSEEEYSLIEPALEEFQKRTSIYLDLYGTTFIYRDQCKLLFEILQLYSTGKGFSFSKDDIKKLDKIIYFFSKVSDDLVAEGE